MKRYIPWLTLGLLGAAIGGSTFACSSDSGGSGGSGATASGGSGGAIVGGSGGTGATDGAVGGTGGTGGTTTQTKLGAKCTKDAECGTGLTCILANSGLMDGEGPPKGVCTADCTDQSETNPVCSNFGANAVCLKYESGKAYCVEGCTFGPDSLQNFDSKKCHGRPEMACSGLLSSTAGDACGPAPNYDCKTGEACGNDEKCHAVIPACLPRCNADADCGTGLKCNPDSGLCGTTLPAGKTLGEACTSDPDAGTDDCQGACINFGDDLRACGALCTIGANPSCGWSGTGPAPSWCAYSTSTVADNGGPGLGDLGLCIQFCDCDADCKNTGLRCHDFGTDSAAVSLKNYTKRQGACFNPKNSQDGGMDPGIPVCATDAGTGGAGGTDAGTGGTGGTGGSTGGTGGTSDASTD